MKIKTALFIGFTGMLFLGLPALSFGNGSYYPNCQSTCSLPPPVIPPIIPPIIIPPAPPVVPPPAPAAPASSPNVSQSSGGHGGGCVPYWPGTAIHTPCWYDIQATMVLLNGTPASFPKIIPPHPTTKAFPLPKPIYHKNSKG